MDDYLLGEENQKRQFEAEKAEAARYYTSEVINALASDFCIDGPEQIERFVDCLQFAARAYQNLKSEEDKRLRPKFILLQLQDVANLSAELKTKLDFLSPETQEILWRQGTLKFRAIPLLEVGLNYGPMGETIVHRKIDPDTHEFRFLNRDDIREAVELINNYARTALDNMSRDDGGLVPSEALSLWVSNMQEFWTNVLGRKFAYNPSKRDTDATRFCREALKFLDPDVTATALSTAMRKAIKSAGTRMGKPHRGARKNPQSNS